jgi:two-component system, sensor histidine kinase
LRLRLPQRRVLVNTDVQSLHRVLGNLISNGIKFTDRAGRQGRGVVVRARFRAGRCRIDVVDTGLGIAPEHRSLVWEPYQQINNAERNRERGLGLGLYLVRRIIEQLPGHEVSMQSILGRGSRFTVELPATTLSDTQALSVLRAPDQTPGLEVASDTLAGAYVLLLEDDHEARLSMQELFEEWGVLYASGATLNELLEKHDESERLVDAIVCDYRLPGGVDGLECIADLRARLGYSPRAVLVTGEPDPEALRARVGPETIVLHKPFAASALAAPLVDAVRAMRVTEQARD